MQIKIGLDIDGVLADFIRGFYKYFNKPMPPITQWEDTFVNNNFEKIAHDKDFWLNLPRAIEPEQLEGISVYCYITARPVDPHVSFKWLQDNGFPFAPVFGVGSNGAHHDPKTEIIKLLELNYFVDDKLQHFQQINEETDCTCFLWNTPWTSWETAEPKLFNMQQLKHHL